MIRNDGEMRRAKEGLAHVGVWRGSPTIPTKGEAMMTPELYAWASQRPAPRIRYIATSTRYAMPRAARDTRRKAGEDAVETPSNEADQLVVLIAEDEETI